jgi:hypothetical protein
MTHKPTEEQLGAPSLKIGGFAIWVHGRQIPTSDDYYDGNWLRVTAHCGELGASVWASGALVMVPDFVRWADQCNAVLRGEAREASLAPLEPELEAIISSSDALGHLKLRVKITPDHLRQEHSFEFDVDQSYLPALIRQCREIQSAYPVRGVP